MEKLIKFAAFIPVEAAFFLAVKGIWEPHIDRKIKK